MKLISRRFQPIVGGLSSHLGAEFASCTNANGLRNGVVVPKDVVSTYIQYLLLGVGATRITINS